MQLGRLGWGRVWVEGAGRGRRLPRSAWPLIKPAIVSGQARGGYGATPGLALGLARLVSLDSLASRRSNNLTRDANLSRHQTSPMLRIKSDWGAYNFGYLHRDMEKLVPATHVKSPPSLCLPAGAISSHQSAGEGLSGIATQILAWLAPPAGNSCPRFLEAERLASDAPTSARGYVTNRLAARFEQQQHQ